MLQSIQSRISNLNRSSQFLQAHRKLVKVRSKLSKHFVRSQETAGITRQSAVGIQKKKTLDMRTKLDDDRGATRNVTAHLCIYTHVQKCTSHVKTVVTLCSLYVTARERYKIHAVNKWHTPHTAFSGILNTRICRR